MISPNDSEFVEEIEDLGATSVEPEPQDAGACHAPVQITIEHSGGSFSSSLEALSTKTEVQMLIYNPSGKPSIHNHHKTYLS